MYKQYVYITFFCKKFDKFKLQRKDYKSYIHWIWNTMDTILGTKHYLNIIQWKMNSWTIQVSKILLWMIKIGKLVGIFKERCCISYKYLLSLRDYDMKFPAKIILHWLKVLSRNMVHPCFLTLEKSSFCAGIIYHYFRYKWLHIKRKSSIKAREIIGKGATFGRDLNA